MGKFPCQNDSQKFLPNEAAGWKIQVVFVSNEIQGRLIFLSIENIVYFAGKYIWTDMTGDKLKGIRLTLNISQSVPISNENAC